MVAPAIQAIARDFDITNEVESQMVLSIFVLAYAIGPLFLGPLSEIYGRVPVLQLGNLFYLIFNTAAGGCKNSGQMIAFRFLSGLGGSAPLAVCDLSQPILIHRLIYRLGQVSSATAGAPSIAEKLFHYTASPLS